MELSQNLISHTVNIPGLNNYQKEYDMKKILVLTLLATILVAACANTNEQTDVEYDIVGTVTEITIENESEVIRFLIETDSNQYDYDKAYVRLTKDTNIQLENSKERLESTSIQLGQTLGVVFDGDVAESYPVQATAGQIMIFK